MFLRLMTNCINMTSFSFSKSLLYVVFFIVSAVTGALYAQDCPFGIENCKGGCGRWIDLDGDGMCDRSSNLFHKPDSISQKKDTVSAITNHEEKTLTQAETQHNPKVHSKTELISNQSTHDTLHSESSEPKVKTDVQEEEADEATYVKKAPPRYRFIFFSALTIGTYLLSLIFVRLNIYKKKIHRRIWNILLLVTFLVSGILGLILVLQINYQILSSWFLQFLKWHVDFGIGMAWISIFHIIWHYPYFKNMFRTRNENSKQL